jgi:hypothetical protein
MDFLKTWRRGYGFLSGFSPFPFTVYSKFTVEIVRGCVSLKVHKIENFFGSDFEFCVISLLVMLKY